MTLRVSYLKRFERDLTPTVRFLNIRGGQVLETSFKKGRKVAGETLVVCQRTPNEALIFNLQTDKDSVSFKVPAHSDKRRQHQARVDEYREAKTKYDQAMDGWKIDIAVYNQRINELSKIETRGPGGKDGGDVPRVTTPTPPPGAHIFEVYFVYGERINKLGYRAKLPDGTIFDSGGCGGGKSASEEGSFAIDLTKERLTTIVTRHGSNEGLESVDVWTDTGRQQHFGGNGGSKEVLQSPGGDEGAGV